ncbi:MAG: AraC family transcriptional regulator ligand-binding domain-containing protein [Deltaproteobacteria bacterium]|nr:AraC family transcriptional regulator ligand-binding domain-containing protein [Deltaproteobacteria bacterium]MCW5802865.1 AraC family transcriptional regulator ligand-binding domain-containing protein [Deltaproteobacteria bacterium]
MEAGSTTLATVVLTFVEFGARRGIPRARLLELAGLDGAPADPDARVSDLVLVKLWGELLAQLPGVPIPLELVRESKVPIGIVAHIVRNAATLREALEIGGRYSRLGDGDYRGGSIARDDGTVGIVTSHRPEVVAMGLPIETMMGWAFKLFGDALGRPLPLREVTYAHAARFDVAPYEAFYGAPVRFSAGANAMWVDPATLDLPLAAADPALRGWLLAHAERMLADLPADEDPLLRRLRGAIAEELAAGAELSRVARRLALSVRTLQRRLAELDRTYQELVDDVRAQAAKRLLRDRERSTLDAAFELGYSDLPSFYRAFKRWTGATPAEWRSR